MNLREASCYIENKNNEGDQIKKFIQYFITWWRTQLLLVDIINDFQIFSFLQDFHFGPGHGVGA